MDQSAIHHRRNTLGMYFLPPITIGSKKCYSLEVPVNLMYKKVSHIKSQWTMYSYECSLSAERWWSAQGRSSPEGREKENCR